MNGYAVALKNNIMQLDEVRAKEDLEPTGFNFMRLGLDSVLLDVKTNRIYTPNTNQYQDLGAAPKENDDEGFFKGKSEDEDEKSLTDKEERGIIEERSSGNPNHDNKGRFTFGSVKMSKKEYVRVSHQIATDFPSLEADGKMHPYENRNSFYVFAVVEFGKYNFLKKLPLENNQDLISDIRDFIREENQK
jgi:hypothetical protein